MLLLKWSTKYCKGCGCLGFLFTACALKYFRFLYLEGIGGSIFSGLSCQLQIKGKPGEDVGHWEYELVVSGCPTRAQRMSVGHPGITSEYSWLSHI